jgi:hypothetical protein
MPQRELFGYPVALSSNMPTNLGAGTNESRVIVGDFQKALILDRMGVTIDTSAHVHFASNRTVFRGDAGRLHGRSLSQGVRGDPGRRTGERLGGTMAKRIIKDESGGVIAVEQDEVLSADHELAVQGHEVGGPVNGANAVSLDEPSPNDVAEAAAKAKQAK